MPRNGRQSSLTTDLDLRIGRRGMKKRASARSSDSSGNASAGFDCSTLSLSSSLSSSTASSVLLHELSPPQRRRTWILSPRNLRRSLKLGNRSFKSVPPLLRDHDDHLSSSMSATDFEESASSLNEYGELNEEDMIMLVLAKELEMIES